MVAELHIGQPSILVLKDSLTHFGIVLTFLNSLLGVKLSCELQVLLLCVSFELTTPSAELFSGIVPIGIIVTVAFE